MVNTVVLLSTELRTSSPAGGAIHWKAGNGDAGFTEVPTLLK